MLAYYSSNLPDIKAVTRVGGGGKILYTVPVKPGVAGKDISYQQHMKIIFKSHRPVVSDVFKSMQGYPAVAFHVPVFKDGIFHGTLAVLIPFSKLAARFIENIKLGESGHAWMISEKGTQLYCSTPGNVGRDVTETDGGAPSKMALTESMMKGGEGTTAFNSGVAGKGSMGISREHAAYASADLGNTHWSLAVATPEKEVLATLQGFRNRLVMIVSLLAVVCLTYFYFGIRAWTIIRDQEARKRDDLALRKNEEKYRQLADLLPQIVFETDADGVLTFVNRIAFDQFGFRREDFTESLSMLLAVAPEDRERARELIDRLMAGETVPGSEYRLSSRDGRFFPGMVYASPIFNEGKAVGIRGIVVDLTDMRVAERALIDEEQKFRTLVEESPLGVLLIGQQGNFKYINPKFTDIFGYGLDDIPNGEKWFEHAYPDVEKRKIAVDTWKADLSDLEVGETRLRTFTAACRDNSEKVINFKAVKLSSGDQLITCEDITEKNRLEEQFRQAQRMEAIGTLAGGVAHDFNNLLMGIQGRTSIMLMDLDSSHRHFQSLKSIEDYIQSAADLTKQLLGYARGGRYEVKSTDLNELIKKQDVMLGRARKEIAIHEDFESNLPAVEVDRGQMEQVFLNLYVNAWHAMPGGGSLYVKTKTVALDSQKAKPFKVASGKYVQVTVRDTGVGMDDATLDKIFDPFFTTKGLGRGTGLGLASVYGIIKNHKGFITAVSEKGQGTSFKFFIPISVKKVEKDALKNGFSVKGTETILLVDDEPMIIDVGKNLLSALGYEVIWAESGESAVSIYKQMHGKIDLVLLDMIMPGMGGREVYDRLIEINPDAKVILSSGYSIDGKAKEILKRGCNGFIQKPYGINDLSSKIREVLD